MAFASPPPTKSRSPKREWTVFPEIAGAQKKPDAPLKGSRQQNKKGSPHLLEGADCHVNRAEGLRHRRNPQKGVLRPCTKIKLDRCQRRTIQTMNVLYDSLPI